MLECLTCSVADAIFSDKVNEPEDLNVLADTIYSQGIFDTSEDGPFADWSILYIPYCTGDVHWGDATVEYSDTLTIHHKGYQNTKAALEFAYERIQNPKSVFVTGCSAGAYGSILNSARIAEHYPDAIVSVMADSGAGIITETFLLDSFPNWNALQHLPDYLERLQAPLEDLSIEDVYISITETFPHHRFTQYTTAFDADQHFYWEVMGGDFFEFPGRLKASLDTILEEAPNFRVYVAPGSMHCISFYPFFETREVNGVKFKDWLVQLVEGETPPDSVRCEGEGCYGTRCVKRALLRWARLHLQWMARLISPPMDMETPPDGEGGRRRRVREGSGRGDGIAATSIRRPSWRCLTESLRPPIWHSTFSSIWMTLTMCRRSGRRRWEDRVHHVR